MLMFKLKTEIDLRFSYVTSKRSVLERLVTCITGHALKSIFVCYVPQPK
jgi:hypothetical protein